jgi:hypothetical protein
MVQTAWPKVRFGAIGEAWRLYRRFWGVWSLTALTALLCASVGSGVAAAALGVAGQGPLGMLIGFPGSGAPLLSVLVTSAIAGFFLGGMMRMAVNQVRGRRPHLEDLFTVTDIWFDLVLGSVLLGLFSTIGFSLLFLPGLIVGGLFMFMLPLIVDGRLPATGAMIQSFDATKSQWLLATVVHLAMFFASILGGILFVIGIVLTIPLYALSVAVLYRDLFLNPYSPAWGKPHKPFDEYDVP